MACPSHIKKIFFLDFSIVLTIFFPLVVFIYFKKNVSSIIKENEEEENEVSSTLISANSWLLAFIIIDVIIFIVSLLISYCNPKRFAFFVLAFFFLPFVIFWILLSYCFTSGEIQALKVGKNIWDNLDYLTIENIQDYYDCKGFDIDDTNKKGPINGDRKCSKLIEDFYDSDLHILVYFPPFHSILAIIDVIICIYWGFQIQPRRRRQQRHVDVYAGLIPDPTPLYPSNNQNNPTKQKNNKPTPNKEQNSRNTNESNTLYTSEHSSFSTFSDNVNPYASLPGYDVL